MENIIIVASKVQGNVIETYNNSTFEKSDSMITDNCCVRKNKKLFRWDLYCHNMPIRCIFSPDDGDYKTHSKQMYLFKTHTGNRKKKGWGIP